MTGIVKVLNEKINIKVMLVFSIVLAGVLLCTTTITNYYSTGFIKEQRVKYNARAMEKVINNLNLLDSQIIQFLNNYNRQDQYKELYKLDLQAFDFDFLKAQIEFETDAENILYANNLQNTIKDVVFYFDDSFMFALGDRAFDSEFKVSESDWYKQFKNSKNQYMLFGPIKEDYWTENTVKEDVVLYMSKIITTSSKEGKPFVMACIRFSEIQKQFDQLLSGSRGIVVSDSKGGIVYSCNMSEGNIEILKKQDHYHALKKQEEDYVTYSDNGMFITSMYDENSGWVISTVDSTKELFKDVNKLVNTLNLVVGLFGVAGIIISQIFIRRLMMPIHLLYGLINKIEEKDTYIKVTTNDEIGQIGRRFNHMKKKLQEINERMYLAEVREKEAQISALQAQINPHFLYNTLDNIYCIAQIEEIVPIVKLTQGLSNIMRYSIDCKDMYTTMQEEIKHVEAYLEIINVRYDESVKLVVNIEEGLEKAKMIKLLLQPIVENAWVHGILKRPGQKGTITIDIHRSKADVEIVVEDDGVGITGDVLNSLNDSFCSFTKEIRVPENKGFGIAMINVNDRIKLMNGTEYGIHISSEKDVGSRVTVKLKYMENDKIT